VDFPGGTVAQYIDALRKTSPDLAVNIIASERASKQMLTAISLKDVSLAVAANAIQAGSASTTGAWVIEPIPRPDPRITLPNAVFDSYSVDYLTSRRGFPDIFVEAFSLQKILRQAGDGKEDPNAGKSALTAIETGLQLQNADRENPPELKFHQESGMLFVRGEQADVHLVGQIISRMSDDAEYRRAVNERRAKQDKLTEVAVKEATIEVQLHQMEVAAAQRSLDMISAQVAKGLMSQNEVQQASLELGRAKFNLERAELNVERAKLQIPMETGTGDASPQMNEMAKMLDRLSEENRALRDQLAAAQKGKKPTPPPPNDAENPPR
jgi:hypothetical protein